ncbi:hypothetical protein CC1G_03477 [Coprinopsis cinerea okayama7|uniref:Beta-glucuronidase C-terminal domain-containing protein n=1 Tax=Coprinopsis cinerea (strain Okayama-7 / 130 / ATCC MYA-4618 / FGSC 9003) TaxID=240176 RepID=A8NCB9_COPC7|nr:hypothetical protein CC1G_03477 [Coprinopsis cinerea okayama7\|eukprot:XP_001832463.2 hypothetical protein CC1G_03477 [Coprinopsis cinerea okayama7\
MPQLPSSLVVAVSLLSVVRALNVTLPARAPSSANSIAPDHFSLSIELDGWLNWIGNDTRNEFFYNALDNIVRLTGVPPRIRVGGKSQDKTFWAQTADTITAVYPPATDDVPFPEPLRVTVGDNFYYKSLFLPDNTKLIHGLNFQSMDSLRGVYHLNSILNSYSVLPEFKERNIRLDAVEAGHEPDLYDNKYPPPYTPQKYVNEWTSWTSGVLDFIPFLHPEIHEYGLKYWAGSLSASSRESDAGFSPHALFKEGLLTKTKAGTAITTVSQHHYSGGSNCASSATLQDFVGKSQVRSSLSVLSTDISVTRANKLEYVLGETGILSCQKAGVSNVAGSVIWSLDYLLQAAQLGVSRVFFHQRIGSLSNIIQPSPLSRSPIDGKELSSPLQPHVQPQYYAAIIAAEAIGSSGNVRVSELKIDNPSVSAYAFYEGNTLSRAIFINSQVYRRSDGRRPSVRVTLNLPGQGPRIQPAILKRLAIASADDTSNLSWGGVTYETEDARPSGREWREHIIPGQGFDLRATEVVLVSFD